MFSGHQEKGNAMLNSRVTIAAGVSALALVGCSYMPWHKDTSADLAPPPESAEPVIVTVEETVIVEEQPEACDVLDSRDWSAWINKMPGPDAVPAVHVTGKVDVRTSGYTFEWQEGPMDRSAMPTLRLKLVPKAPDGMAMQVISTEEVHYTAPALATGYRGVLVSCGGKTLAEITEITDAH